MNSTLAWETERGGGGGGGMPPGSPGSSQGALSRPVLSEIVLKMSCVVYYKSRLQTELFFCVNDNQ